MNKMKRRTKKYRKRRGMSRKTKRQKKVLSTSKKIDCLNSLFKNLKV